MLNNVETIKKFLHHSRDSTPSRVALFFKTKKSGYAEHDHFMGISVPTLRKIARSFLDLSLEDLALFLASEINEERLFALIILTHRYKKASLEGKEELYIFYKQHLKAINNWNLVDNSAHLIIGAHLWDKDRKYLEVLATSHSVWERRIAIVSTWHFIRQGDFEWTFKIALMLHTDSHDLIHKAVGWMLREAGKKDHVLLVRYLEAHGNTMPRTMLRYAIEKFPEEQRKFYLQKTRRAHSSLIDA